MTGDEHKRRKARKTALMLGLVAVLIYAIYIAATALHG